MTQNIMAMQLLMSEKLIEAGKSFIGAQSERELLEIAEQLDMISTFIKRKLIEEMLVERESFVTA